MHTRHEARVRLTRHVADLRALIARAERNVPDSRFVAEIAALSERITHDLMALYRLREGRVDELLHGVVEPALERARDALRTARGRPGALTRTLEAAAEALTRVA